MKNNKKHRSIIRLFSVLLGLFGLTHLQAQTSPEHLWGAWEIESIEINKPGLTEIHSLESLLEDKENLPRNLFTRLYFFDDQVGVNYIEEAENLNQKGTFSVEDGKLLITMRNEQTRVFTYTIEGDLLKIGYAQDDTQFYLVYKSFKNKE